MVHAETYNTSMHQISRLADWVTTVLTYEYWSYHAMGLIWVWVSDYLKNALFGKMAIS